MKIHQFSKIVYVRITEDCNLRCKHCFIPPNPKHMSDDQVLAIPKKLSDLSISGTILLQWHGGEPTLIPAQRVKKLIILLNKSAKLFNLNFIHGIQTNLVRIQRYPLPQKEAWFDLLNNFFEHKYIGVSWDKDIREKDSTIFERDFNLGLSSMRDAFKNPNFSPALTITATLPFVLWVQNNPNELITWLNKNLITRLHIEKLTPSGTAVENWETIGVSNKQYSDAMSRLFLAYHRIKKINPSINLHISPFDDLILALNGLGQNNVCYAGGCTTSMHTFSSVGYSNRCTAITEEINPHNPKEVMEICHNCEFNTICNGGCPATNNSSIDTSSVCSGSKPLLISISNSLTI